MTDHTYPDPTPEILASPRFEAVWQAIKGWDLQRNRHEGYASATGNDVRHILDALDALSSTPQANSPAETRDAWISVEERMPAFVDDEYVDVYTWDGKKVAEDTYGPEFDQPAGPAIGGWVRVGDNFGDIHRNVTHWMSRSLPAPPPATQSASTRAEGE